MYRSERVEHGVVERSVIGMNSSSVLPEIV
jgi:hypothetical protein